MTLNKPSDKEYTVFALKGEPTAEISMGAVVKRSTKTLDDAKGLSFFASNGLKILVMGPDAETFNGAKPSDTGIGSTLFINNTKAFELTEELPKLGFEMYPSILQATIDKVTTKPTEGSQPKVVKATNGNAYKKFYLPDLSKNDIELNTFVTALKDAAEKIYEKVPSAKITVTTEEFLADDFVEKFDIKPSDENPDEDNAVIILEDGNYNVNDEVEVITVNCLYYIA